MDTLTVTDALGNAASVSIVVGPVLAITPTTASVDPGTAQSFSVSGGSGTGYTWSLSTNQSGATIAATATDGTTARYVAGSQGGVDDVVTAVDPLGNVAVATVHVVSLADVLPDDGPDGGALMNSGPPMADAATPTRDASSAPLPDAAGAETADAAGAPTPTQGPVAGSGGCSCHAGAQGASKGRRG